MNPLWIATAYQPSDPVLCGPFVFGYGLRVRIESDATGSMSEQLLGDFDIRPASSNSVVQVCRNVCHPIFVWADPLPPHCTPIGSANSANPKSPAVSTSAAPRCVVSYHRKRADMATKRINTAQDIYGIKITLLGTNPPIWRRLLVPASMTLAKLHDVLQTAMGWHDCHMHEFRAGERHFGRPDPEDISMGMQVENERNIRLSSVLRRLLRWPIPDQDPPIPPGEAGARGSGKSLPPERPSCEATRPAATDFA